MKTIKETLVVSLFVLAASLTFGCESERLSPSERRDPSEHADWEKAVEQNTIAGYEAFFAAHPKSDRSSESDLIIGRLRLSMLYEEAMRKNTIEGYRAYLEKSLREDGPKEQEDVVKERLVGLFESQGLRSSDISVDILVLYTFSEYGPGSDAARLSPRSPSREFRFQWWGQKIASNLALSTRQRLAYLNDQFNVPSYIRGLPVDCFAYVDRPLLEQERSIHLGRPKGFIEWWDWSGPAPAGYAAPAHHKTPYDSREIIEFQILVELLPGYWTFEPRVYKFSSLEELRSWTERYVRDRVFLSEIDKRREFFYEVDPSCLTRIKKIEK